MPVSRKPCAAISVPRPKLNTPDCRMSFDAILIGAGVNGMTLSAYLQRGGLQTLVVEAELQIGGMARSTRPLLAGFVHNPHANYLMQMDISPVVRDLELSRYGLRTIAFTLEWPEAVAAGARQRFGAWLDNHLLPWWLVVEGHPGPWRVCFGR